MAKRDWKNDADFEFTKDLDFDGWGWGWEFLRRNSDYRDDWNKVLQTLYQITPADKVDIKDDDFCIEQNQIDCKKKWWIERFVNPDTDYPIMLDFVNSYSYGHIYRNSTKIDLLQGQVAAIFDLRLPITRQVKLIRSRLGNLKKEYKRKGLIEAFRQPKTQSDKWRSYLRVLDAKTDGASDKEIDEIVFCGKRQHPDDPYYYNKVIRDAVKSAMKLVKGGYRNILSGP
jgi:hypothetical protein